jgi:protein-L-isoaspartate(D-aspartate) O-methyltransferase
VNVAAAAREGVPPALADQLAPGGRLVAPVGEFEQRLVVVERTPAGDLRETRLEPVRFVPLIS